MDNLQDYLDRSGDTELMSGNAEVHKEHGFCIWQLHEGNVHLIQVYGNGAYWNTWAENKAKELGVNKIVFATKRNPEGFCRKYKYKVIGHILERSL